MDEDREMFSVVPRGEKRSIKEIEEAKEEERDSCVRVRCDWLWENADGDLICKLPIGAECPITVGQSEEEVSEDV